MNFEQMSKEELVERLKRLEGARGVHDGPSEEPGLVNSSQVHEVELELQNRSLREMQGTLEESRSRYAELYDSAPIAYFTFDENGCVLEVNLAGAAMVGLDRSEVLGSPFSSLMRMEEPAIFWSHLRHCAETRAPGICELALSRMEGVRLCVQAASTPVLGSSGRVVAWRTAFTDITARRQAEADEQAARAGEQQLRAQLEAVDGAALRVTHALATPREPTEAVLQCIAEQATLLTQADYGALAVGERTIVVPPCPGIEGVLGIAGQLSGRTEPAGVPFTDPPLRDLLGGPLLFGEARLGTLYVANKRGPAGFSERDQHSLEMLAERVGHAIQIARLHDEQRRDRDRLQLLSDTGRALASTLDHAEALTRVARLTVPRFADWVVLHRWEQDRLQFGFAAHREPARELQLHRFYEHFEALRDGPTGLLAQVAATRQPVLVSQSSHTHPVEGADGTALAAELEGLDVGSCLGVPVMRGERLLGTMFFHLADPGRPYDPRDLALAEELAFRTALALDNARLYQEARSAVRSRDNVMAIVSHDLRNPLNAIALNLSLLTRPWAGDGEGTDRRKGRSQLESIQRSVQRVGRMVEDLLAASTIQSGHFTVRASPERPEVILADLVQTLEPMASNQGTCFEAAFPRGLPLVACDRDRVLQVFGNLCGNALHVTPRGGLIRVTAERVDGVVRFSVTDTGPGIPACQLPSVFDRYWQADPGSSSGVGLGLFIVKGIVEAHGGRVWAQSTEGQGATFSFTLPVAT